MPLLADIATYRLHRALQQKKNAKAISTILEDGARIHAKTFRGDNSLHIAAGLNPHPDVCQLLLDKGALLEETTDWGLTALHRAAANNSPRVVNVLLDNGADMRAKSDQGSTPLTLAAELNSEVAALLLMRGADAEETGHKERTALHFAAGWNKEPLEVINALLDGEASVHATDEDGNTPLHLAAWFNSSPEVAALLLKRGADIRATTNKEETPLHVAAAWNKKGVVEVLLEHGAGLEARDESGCTPLHRAAESSSRLGVPVLLVHKGANVSARDENESTPLHRLAFNKSKEASQLLEAFVKAEPKCLWERNKFGFLPADMAQLFPLGNKALVPEFRQWMEVFSEEEGEEQSSDEPSYRRTPLDQRTQMLHMTIAQKQGARAVAYLLRLGVEVNAKSWNGVNSLHLAAAVNPHPDVCALLLEKGARLEEPGDVGRTALHQAAQLNSPEVVSVLLNHGANMLAKDDQGSTPLNIAAERNLEVALFLVRRGADLSVTGYVGRTPLHNAAAFSTTELVTAMLDHNADIQATDDQGSTPLHVAACLNCRPEVAALLVDRGADISAIGMEGKTPLHAAAGWNTKEVVEVLLEKGADLEAKCEIGLTPLHFSADKSTRPEVAAFLLERGARASAKDHEGLNAMHRLALNSETAAASTILETLVKAKPRCLWKRNIFGKLPVDIARLHQLGNRALVPEYERWMQIYTKEAIKRAEELQKPASKSRRVLNRLRHHK